MQFDITALCLRSVDYKESDKLLTLASLERGKITVKVRGARGAKAKLKSGCTPLCFGEYTLTDGKTGFTVTGINVKENFFAAWSDLEKNVAASLCLEILDKISAPENDVSREVILTLKALKEITYGEVVPLASLVWYFSHILTELGEDLPQPHLPKDLFTALSAVINLDIDELSSFDAEPSVLPQMLSYMNLTFQNNLGINLKIFKEAARLLF